MPATLNTKINDQQLANNDLIKQAVQLGIAQLSPIMRSNEVTQRLTQATTNTAPPAQQQVAKQAGVQKTASIKGAMQATLGKITQSTTQQMEDVSPVGASLLFQYLAQPQAMAPHSQTGAPTPVAMAAQDILSGLGEGVGDIPPADTSEPEQSSPPSAAAAPNAAQPGQAAPQPGEESSGEQPEGAQPASTPEEAAMANNQAPQEGGKSGPSGSLQAGPDAPSAVEPGKENLPMFDMSPQAKEEFAKQEMDKQDATAPQSGSPEGAATDSAHPEQAGAAGPGGSPTGTPEEHARNLQQQQHQAQQQQSAQPGYRNQAQAGALADAASTSGIDDKDFNNEVADMRKLGGSRNPQSTAAIQKSGNKLAESIKERMSGSDANTAIIIMTTIADMTDAMDPTGMVSFFVKCFVIPGTIIAKISQKTQNWRRFIMVSILEAIPGINYLPLGSLNAIFTKYEDDEKILKQKMAHDDITRLLKK